MPQGRRQATHGPSVDSVLAGWLRLRRAVSSLGTGSVLEELVTVGAVLERSTVSDICGAVLQAVHECVGCVAAAVMVVDGGNGPATHAYPSGFSRKIPFEEIIRWVDTSPSLTRRSVSLHEIEGSTLRWVVPLMARERLLGLLIVGRHPGRAHSAREKSILLGVAANASLALEGLQVRRHELSRSMDAFERALGDVELSARGIPLTSNPERLAFAVKVLNSSLVIAREAIRRMIRASPGAPCAE